MANALYDKGRNSFLADDGIGGGQTDWLADDIRVILGDAADYTVDLVNHDFLNDVPAAARVAVSGAFSGKTAVAGVADANNVTLTAVTGDVSEFLIIYKHTGVESTSRLLAYIDSATNLPVTPNGGDIVIQWDNGANKIFKL